MSALLDKLKKNSTIKDASILSDSVFFKKKDIILTEVPAINIALSGSLTGGLTPGVTMWAGPSKHFKTAFSLLMAKSYLDKYPDAILLFYDSEFGTPQGYFEAFGISLDRVFHTPITNVEQLKFDCAQQMEQLKRGDKCIVIIDSIGNLASKKEVDDAMNENSAADFTRAKQLKSFFRIVTPHLTMKDIPMVVVNHTYMTMEMFSKPVVGGGTGSYYSADNIFIIGRQQEKAKSGEKELLGYNFIINVEKSRYVREKSKIPITVLHKGGISRWSGLLDLATESGNLFKTKLGAQLAWSVVNMETGEVDDKKWTAKNTENKDFWEPILACPKFQAFIESKYKVASGDIIQSDGEDDGEAAEVFGNLSMDDEDFE